LDSFVVLVLRLAAGILAVQEERNPVSVDDAMKWATAAAYHANVSGLDPFELVGIARNETDFRPDLIGPDGKDCGLTQTRITYSKYRCKQLRQDTWIAFAEAARELRENQARCKKKNPGDLTRCRVNSYNQGIKYKRTGWKGRYWLRVHCFAEAARAGVKPVTDCRRVKNRKDIARLIHKSRMRSEPLSTARISSRTGSSL
jgi:hypothetical protein